VICFRGVSHTYAGAQAPHRALHEFDLELAAGECIAIVGASGSGKTTALRLVNGLETLQAGTLEVQGRTLTDWDRIELRRSIGYVIQSAGLFPHLTVGQNIGLLGRLDGWSRRARDARQAELLNSVGLDPGTYLTRFPRELSGGEAQRVGVARALFMDPPMLLMDEPFGALDAMTRRNLQRSFVGWQAASPRGILLVTHDLAEAARLANRIAILNHGKLEQVGSWDELQAAPATPYVHQLLGDL